MDICEADIEAPLILPFESMLADIQKQSEYERKRMEKLKSEGKEKSATYRQYFGNRMLYKMILEKYREYGLID